MKNSMKLLIKLKTVVVLTMLFAIFGFNSAFSQIKVDANGYVGINNSSPTKNLDVTGDTELDYVHISGNADITGSLEINGTTYIDDLSVPGNATIDGELVVDDDVDMNNVTISGDATINNLEILNELDVTTVNPHGYNLTFIGDYADIVFEAQGDPKLYPTTNEYGNLGISSKRFGIVFTKYLNGDRILLTSDKRKKENIKSLENALDIVTKIDGKKYDFKTDQIDTIRNEQRRNKLLKESKGHIGFLAQDLESILPEAVSYDEENDAYYVDYIAVIPYLVEAIKELKGEIDDLQTALAQSQQKSILGNNSDIKYYNTAKLEQNIPNPFKNQTKINMTIPSTVSKADLYVYDMQGKQKKHMLVEERGETFITIQSSELEAGMYLYTLITDGKEVDTKKMILTKN